jgi:hypothetical protein
MARKQSGEFDHQSSCKNAVAVRYLASVFGSLAAWRVSAKARRRQSFRLVNF